MAAGKVKDKTHTFHSTKVRAIGSCSSCAAKRCIYSNKMVGNKDGPSKKDLERLEILLEKDTYTCGIEMKVPSLLDNHCCVVLPLNLITTIHKLEQREEG